ncbi:mandelate racemase/muconate lactonizing enzyme family protein [Alpinimonas psychrophila]|uniref:L-alanine-DL-glutamate epimerase-like enolase superfamily enzyme n=1 Tax=Alpinimonas psychrophila TaxID=748908 RepID=A0A7W3PP28_9MICO|nr:mandelate racemase/muconate lactonizing enzyme family protein [Alpinimonas psychrophila]MBA8829035.1 L-alanine-DL-glutamate epimerase-like enolase superfamily enzyme [Alpinimonas psychrophila]
MKIRSVQAIPASIAYNHREVSFQVARDGVSDVVVRVETEDGTVGWGESCSGSDTVSIVAAIEAMSAFVVGRSPWDVERMRKDLLHHGLWQFREGTANFAWAGIDMALWDLCGKDAGVPVYKLLGGAVRDSVNYFYYLSWDNEEDMRQQCARGLSLGYGVFYLKVGRDIEADVKRVALVREIIGTKPLLRLDANGAWSPSEAISNLRKLQEFDIDFMEQPVKESPPELMRRVRDSGIMPIAANEGLWTEADAISRILAEVADVYCFSQYWVGSLRNFQFIGSLAGRQGGTVCKHTHGEFSIAATAAHHVLLTLPKIVEGNQQTSAHMTADLSEVPIKDGPKWGLPIAPGLGVEIDQDQLADASARYQRDGQFLPYQLDDLRAGWRL